MALIGKIRQNSWLLILAIGIGMAGFLLMDMTANSSSSLFGGSQTTIGKINGETIDYNSFANLENLRGQGGDTYGVKENVWNYIVRDRLTKQLADKIGMNVGDQELEDLFLGNNPSPVVRNAFGQNFSSENVQSYIDQMDQLTDEQRAGWKDLEEQVRLEALGSKLNAMVGQGLYTPNWLAEAESSTSNQTVDFEFVSLPFTEVTDAEVGEIKAADIKNYMSKNKAKYTRDEETRTMEYVSIMVEPTAADSGLVLAEVERLKENIQTSKNDSSFVMNQRGEYGTQYLPKDAFDEVIKENLFDQPEGTIYGPYLDQGNYTFVKSLGKMRLRDSVRVRHILRGVENPEQNIASLQVEAATIDSLIDLLENKGARFDSLALKFGQDATAATGGFIGEGYVQPNTTFAPFNDLIFFRAERNKYYSLVTQAGVHLVQVTNIATSNEQGMRMAKVSKPIVPSEETQDKMYNAAFAITGNNRTLEALRAAAKEEGLTLKVGAEVKLNDYVFDGLSGQSARDMIKWSHKADIGDVASEVYIFRNPVNFYNERYVIAGLSGVNPAGMMSADNASQEVMNALRNERKGSILAEKISGNDLNTLATEFETEVQKAQGVSLKDVFIPGLGNEPKAVATAFATAVGETSQKVIGTNGVFLVRVLAKPVAQAVPNLPDIKRQMNLELRRQAPNRLFESMKKSAKISDNRSKFF